jgi:Protein of unknown function (DUF2442)
MLHVIKAQHYKDYKISIAFDDGTIGIVDLGYHLSGSIFEPLRNIEFFSQLTLDPELETVTWPNGADFAPEFLKEHLQKQ